MSDILECAGCGFVACKSVFPEKKNSLSVPYCPKCKSTSIIMSNKKVCIMNCGREANQNFGNLCEPCAVDLHRD